MHEITRLLSAEEPSDSQTSERLLALVYDELRKLAAAKLSQERSDQTLQATALVHEAWLRLIGDGKTTENWNSRAHFFGAAAEAIRRILIERARHKGRLKHGGEFDRIELSDFVAPSNGSSADLLDLDQALSELERNEPAKAQLVKLRYFAGLTIDEAAAALDISPATAKRHWAYARAWLFGKLHQE